MSDSLEKAAEQLPRAALQKRKLIFPVIWVVPIAAALVAGYLVFERVRQFGPEVTIRFRDGGGLRSDLTPLKYRGVQIGEVSSIELSEDHQDVLVKARLRRAAASIAREGSLFWIVRPEVGLSNITGLGTVLTGPEIQVLPGTGAPRNEFNGLDSAPVALEAKGLKIVLRSPRSGSLRANSPVYYRGVEVGVVQEIDLAPNATAVNVQVLIRQGYAGLVRGGSVFWRAGGASVSAGLLNGLEFKVESLRALVAGGVEFATPNDAGGKRVKDGAAFTLYDEPRKEWLGWSPQIRLSHAK